MLAGPLGRAATAAPGCAGQLVSRRWDRAVGGGRREKVMELMCEKKNSGGLGEKGAKTHSSQDQIKNI
jgi:hypothetical protein